MAALGASFDDDSHHFSQDDELDRGRTLNINLGAYTSLKKPKKSAAPTSLSR